MAQEDDTPHPKPPFPIVGVGASAGGVRALQNFFDGLPENTGAAFVVIVHLDPDHQSELSKVLAVHTRMPVRQVDHSVDLVPDHVYVIPPNQRIFITDHEVSVAKFDEPRGHRAPIDFFFRSMAEQRGDGFAVVLSGAGSDGTLGVKAVKEAGGIILVQDPNEAEYGSMPRSAIASGHVDFVLPAHELGAQLAELARGKEFLKTKTAVNEDEESLGRILAHLRVRTGHDFTQYKRASLMRRLERRMQVIKASGLAAYLNYLREHSEEVQALFADLLISVTSFFRDPLAFEQLSKRVIPEIFDRKGADQSIRVWVPGCATGEEAYSIAILLLEEAGQRTSRPDIQVFASDLDPKALVVAREGCYPSTLASDVSEERLRRFFSREGDLYRIRREVRDLIVFAQHSVLKDPPFSRLDMISCRNLLIYINRDLQQKVLSTFHYALLPEGYLFLGSSETAEHPDGYFRVVDRSNRIFQSSGRRAGEPLAFPRLLPHLRIPEQPMADAPAVRGTTADAQQQHRLSLTELAPPSILVDDMHRILHISDRAGQYLLHPPGMPTLDATEVVRVELGAELRIMLHRAFEEGVAGISLPIPVQFNGHSRNVCLQVSPLMTTPAHRRALVLFIEGGPATMPVDAAGLTEAQGNADLVVKRLQEELLATRANLKVSRQQFETATENLRAANEELQSINEEYRSTAEELETSREELQSMNEELQTLNSELKLKLDAVSRAHDDLQNLMIATDVGTLFLDKELRIKRFTPRMRELFNINPSDEGRRIGDFTNRLDYPNFEKDALNVMEENRQVEREIRTVEDHWFLTHLGPYRTVDGKTEGIVATFVDITQRKRTEEKLRETEARLKGSGSGEAGKRA